MERPFLTFRQRPYDSSVAFLHELRAVCENAMDLHPLEGDPIHGSARDVHDFVDELLMEQENLAEEDGGLEEGEVQMPSTSMPGTSISPQFIPAECQISCNPSTVPPSTAGSAHSATSSAPSAPTLKQVNALLLSEVLNQRQITAQLGFHLLHAMMPHAAPTQKPAGCLREESWDTHSESEEELETEAKPSTSTAALQPPDAASTTAAAASVAYPLPGVIQTATTSNTRKRLRLEPRSQ